MCGATSDQKTLEKSQMAFYDTLTAHYKEVYGEQAGILKSLTSSFEPILKAGINQRGFSDEQRTNLETQATEGVSRNFDKAQQALNENIASRGGSDFIASGADNETRAELAATAASESSRAESQITEADYDTGRSNYLAAANALGGVAAQYDPNGTANAANSGGSAASKTANDIAEADNSVWNAAIGGISGVAGSAVTAWCPAFDSMILLGDGFSRIKVQNLKAGMHVMGIDGKPDRVKDTPEPVLQSVVDVVAGVYQSTVSEGHTFERRDAGYTIARESRGEHVMVGDTHDAAAEVTRVSPQPVKVLCYPIKLERSHGYNTDGIWSLE